MSTIHRHALKNANRSQRMRSPQPPLKKSRWTAARSAKRLWKSRWLWLSAIVIVVSIGLGSWYYSYRAAAAATASKNALLALTASASPAWKTVQTFKGPSTGSSTQTLSDFTVSGKWQLSWVCQGVDGVDDWLYVAIYNSNGTLYNAGAQITCIAAKLVVGNTQEVSGGKFYLTIDANTSWTVSVQEQT